MRYYFPPTAYYDPDSFRALDTNDKKMSKPRKVSIFSEREVPSGVVCSSRKLVGEQQWFRKDIFIIPELFFIFIRFSPYVGYCPYVVRIERIYGTRILTKAFVLALAPPPDGAVPVPWQNFIRMFSESHGLDMSVPLDL